MNKILLSISKIFLGFLIAFIALWQIPELFSLLFASADKQPFTLYSTELKQFIFVGYDAQTEEMNRFDENHKTYSTQDVDSLLPFFYHRQLVADERFPDSINGKPISLQEVKTQNFNFKSNPSDFNKKSIELYPLMETLSGRVNLEMSPDVFRICDDKIEFIIMETNQIDEQKTALFNEMFAQKDFKFPITQIIGNPTTKKDYDEGYLLLDAENHIFHFKQVKARPYLRPIETENLSIKQLFLNEFSDPKFFAFIVDQNNKFYVILRDEYQIRLTEIPAFDPYTETMSIIANPMDWTIKIASTETTDYYAIDAQNFHLLRSYSFQNSASNIPAIALTSPLNKFVFPHFRK